MIFNVFRDIYRRDILAILLSEAVYTYLTKTIEITNNLLAIHKKPGFYNLKRDTARSDVVYFKNTRAIAIPGITER